MPADYNGLRYIQTTKAVQGFDASKACFTALLSTERIDRDGEVILLDGLDLNAFGESDASIMVNHVKTDVVANGKREPRNRSMPAEVWRDGNRLYGKAYFHQKTLLSEEMCKLVASGIINNVSIGCAYLEKPYFGKYNGQKALIAPRTMLSEWSILTVPPANPDTGILDYTPEQAEKLACYLGSAGAGRLPPEFRETLKGLLFASKQAGVVVGKPYTSVTGRQSAMPEVTPAEMAEVVNAVEASERNDAVVDTIKSDEVKEEEAKAETPAEVSEEVAEESLPEVPAMQKWYLESMNMLGGAAKAMAENMAAVSDHQDAGFANAFRGFVGGMVKKLCAIIKEKYPDAELPEQAVADLDDYDPQAMDTLFDEFSLFNDGEASDDEVEEAKAKAKKAAE